MMMNVPVPYNGEYSLLPPNTTDSLLIEMWLEGLDPDTQRAYRRDTDHLLDYAGCSIQQVKLSHLQGYARTLESLGYADSTRVRMLNSMKSLFSFAKKSGYIPLNPGVMIKIRRGKKTLTERILTEEQTLTMIIKEEHPRNHTILRLLYSAGLRVSELCDLTWKDLVAHKETGTLTVFGKGDKTRYVLLSKATYQELLALPGSHERDVPLFPSRGGHGRAGGGHLDPSQVTRVVKTAAIRCKIELYHDEKGRLCTRVSPHWLRHAHATHALDNGAPLTVVSATLGHEDIETTMIYVTVNPEDSSAQYLKM